MLMQKQIKVLFIRRHLFPQGLEDNCPNAKILKNFRSRAYLEVETVEYHEEEWGGREFLRRLVSAARVFRPDVLWLHFNVPNAGVYEAFRELRVHLGVKIAMQFGYITHEYKWAKKLLPYVDYIWHGEHSSFARILGGKAIFSPVPPDLAQVDHESLPRSIDVSFFGDLSMHPSRRRVLGRLQRSGVHVTIGGGYGSGRLPAEQYFRILQQSEIVINFAAVPNGCVVFKGRPFEVFSCGALLFEEVGTEMDRICVPGRDYMAYDSELDLLIKLRGILSEPQKAREIALNGYRRNAELFSIDNVLGLYFRRMGFQLPQTLELSTRFQEYCRLASEMVSTGANFPLRKHRNVEIWKSTRHWLFYQPARGLLGPRTRAWLRGIFSPRHK